MTHFIRKSHPRRFTIIVQPEPQQFSVSAGQASARVKRGCNYTLRSKRPAGNTSQSGERCQCGSANKSCPVFEKQLVSDLRAGLLGALQGSAFEIGSLSLVESWLRQCRSLPLKHVRALAPTLPPLHRSLRYSALPRSARGMAPIPRPPVYGRKALMKLSLSPFPSLRGHCHPSPVGELALSILDRTVAMESGRELGI